MAENVRLGNEEEKALCREGDGSDDEVRGRGGERGRWTWREEGEEFVEWFLS